jgi:hypothetical protein
MRSSVLVEYREAVGRIGTNSVYASVLEAASLLLIARGAETIVVPAPGAFQQERVGRALEDLPRERRHMVRLIDKNAETLKRVRLFLEPLRRQARKWPEDAFVSFSESFLYKAAIAQQTQSMVISDAVEVLRGFIPILDGRVFRDEAAFRLADIVAIVANYEPALAGEGAAKARGDVTRVGRSADELLKSAEFRQLATTAGGLGLAARPSIALKELVRRLRALLARPDAKQTLKLATTVADLSGAGAAAEATDKVLSALDVDAPCSTFRPPFFELGPASVGLYRAALSARFSEALPPQGTIMVFEHYRGDRSGTSWLNEGEESKLQREAQEGIAGRQARAAEVRAVQARFLSHSKAT